METAELRGHSFRCLEGCGFCCTFQPELSRRELALLRARLAPRAVPVAVGEGRTYLQLQNKCGACTLLERRGCTQYDLRPAHCRYFPFHLHFADAPEAYVNYTCRGVEREDGADLGAAFQANVLANANADEIREQARQARETYGTFERKARRAGAWGSVPDVLAEAMRLGPGLLTSEGIAQAAAKGGEPVGWEEILQDALAPFEEADVSRRPFYLAPDLRWLTFHHEGAGALETLEMDERGDLRPVGRIESVLPWRDAPDAAALLPYLQRLTARRLFTGNVYALVDDSDYETTVEEAAWLRLAEMSADLLLRHAMLQHMGTPPERLADEVARFYDTTFLDSPTIGGFL